jgi:vacuolar-type H+-ATPase subunit H
MLIEEIEDAEKNADEIVCLAKSQASARLAIAKEKSFNELIQKARADAETILKNAESVALAEAKKIIASEAKFSLPREAKSKLAADILNRTITASGKDVPI